MRVGFTYHGHASRGQVTMHGRFVPLIPQLEAGES